MIHDFFLPNYRVKLDAVPGMRADLLHRDQEQQGDRGPTRGTYKLDDIAKKSEEHEEWSLVIPEFPEGNPPSKNIDLDDTGRRYFKMVEEEPL